MAYSEFSPDWIVKESQIFEETRSIRGMLLYAPDLSGGFPLETILVVRLLLGKSIRMRSVVIQFVVFKDIHAAVRMVEQVVGVAAHNQSSSHGMGMGSHDQG